MGTVMCNETTSNASVLLDEVNVLHPVRKERVCDAAHKNFARSIMTIWNVTELIVLTGEDPNATSRELEVGDETCCVVAQCVQVVL